MVPLGQLVDMVRAKKGDATSGLEIDTAEILCSDCRADRPDRSKRRPDRRSDFECPDCGCR
ncbi:MAG: hypothetical protein MPW15_15730 [Candidatus Manganitrophus sp.]|nr:hypothetical protein [Candidatus Manganitrophus sp.]